MPEGDKDDGLDAEELEEGSVGLEVLLGRLVEENETVEGEGDAHVVHHRHVQVTPAHSARTGNPHVQVTPAHSARTGNPGSLCTYR